MKKAIVTGATGFIGNRLVKGLLDKDYHVLALVRKNSDKMYRLPEHDHLEITALDLDEIKKLPDMLNGSYDTFFHLAWEGSRAAQRDQKELQYKNYVAAIEAIDTANRMGCKTFICAGSQAEYGSFEGGYIDETYRTVPVAEYGKNKLKACWDCNKKAQQYGMRFVWTRVFSVYGEYDFEDSLIMTCIKKMLKDENVPLSLCIQNWDFIYVNDAAEAFIDLNESEKAQGVYNVASGHSRPLKEFVTEIKHITRSRSKLQFGQIPYGPKGYVSFHPIVDKLKNDTNWKPRTEFRQGIENIINHMKESKYEENIYCNSNL